MKINKEQLKMMADKNDSELWGEIHKIATSHGYKIPSDAPSHTDMERIRGALRGTEKINLADAARIMNSYKKKQ